MLNYKCGMQNYKNLFNSNLSVWYRAEGCKNGTF